MAIQQQQVSVLVEGRQLDLVLGDLFESDSTFLVMPCNTAGRLSPGFTRSLAERGIDASTTRMEPGGVTLVHPSADGGQGILLAAVVTSPESAEQDVRTAARRVGDLLTGDRGSVAFPLLGTGPTDRLAPEVSLTAIATGYGDHPGPLNVHVLDRDVFDRLVNFAGGRVGMRAQRASTRPSSPSSKSSSAEPAASADTGNVADSGSSAADGIKQQAVPTHTDGPAYFDELGREGFARVLAQRIRDARKEETTNGRRARDSRSPRGGAFILHLHAPWGAGKTSVLNFLAAELRRPTEPDVKGCVVVEFNAWRHQRIVPPWWWLMTTLYSGAVRELWQRDKPRAAWLWFRERLWRSKAGWPGYVALLLVVGSLVWAWQAGWFGAVGKEDLFSPDTAKGYLAAAAAIITPALTIWGLLHAMGRWVFTTSARGARRFMANTSDPMRTVQDHVDHLTRWIHHDIVVMIDDLDRCKGPYVVELLEGIQTLFRDVPVTYVIAADRDWLADSYAAEYSGFVSAGGDAGRPVGYLFLEKTFQISTGLPRSGASINTYWNRLLHSPSVPDAEALTTARADSGRALKGKSGTALREEVIANPGNTPAEKQARLEAVAVEMVSERAQQQFQHTLAPFRDLLGRDPNPRAMKRLVNAYGIARGIEILHGLDLKVDHLQERKTALWTILMLRWPKLAGHLGRYPEHLEYVGTPDPPAAVPADLRPLFADPDVVDVVQGRGVDATLTPEFLARSPLR